MSFGATIAVGAGMRDLGCIFVVAILPLLIIIAILALT